MTRRLTPELAALITPIEAVLKPLGFRRVNVFHNGLWLAAHWSGQSAFITATIEPGDQWGELYVARRSDQQPWRANVPIRQVLGAMRQPTPRVPNRPTADVSVLQAWAEGMAVALGSIESVLSGNDLDVLDRVIESRPHTEKAPRIDC